MEATVESSQALLWSAARWASRAVSEAEVLVRCTGWLW